MTSIPAFRLYLWPHRVLYLGLSPDNDLHRHHAAQLCVSLSAGPLRYRPNRDSPWQSAQGIQIPPDHLHQIDAGNAHILALYLEPESSDYPLDSRARDIHELSVTTEMLAALHSLIDNLADADHAWSVCTSTLNLDAHKTPTVSDSRVESVIHLIRDQPGQTFTARQLAETVHLSPSRLSHLFRHQVGVPIRRFIVWSRLRTVINFASQGATLTQAAHAARFSDAAHMSNAFRQMFGFAPSALFATDVAKEVVIVG